MIDWFMLFAPLLLLPVVLLIVFVGCSLHTEGLAVEMRFIVRFFPRSLTCDTSNFLVLIDVYRSGYGIVDTFREEAEPVAVPGGPVGQSQIQFIKYFSRGEHTFACKLFCAGGGPILIGPSSCAVTVDTMERVEVVFNAGDRQIEFSCGE